METPTKSIAPRTVRFCEDFLASFHFPHQKKNQANDKVVNSALIYEKFRTALEYQEDHLIFKNAVSRIVRRKYTLVPGISADELFSDLLNELSWANYLNQDDLKNEQVIGAKRILERYLTLLKSARSANLPKHELNKIIINWFACELDEVIKPVCDSDLLVDYAAEILKKNINLEGSRIGPEDNDLQVKLAVFTTIFKPDGALIEYWLLKHLYPDWTVWPEEKIRAFGNSFDPYYNKIARVLNHPKKARYNIYVKRNIAPFILMKELPLAKGLSTEKIQENPAILKNMLLEIYDSKIVATRIRVWRATFRALIFIFLTKISLALLLEIPFDRYISGEIKYLSLAINILLPPLLMLIAGTFVKSPSSKNRAIVGEAIDSIVISEELGKGKYSLVKKQTSSFDGIFNLVYWLVSLAILVGVTWLLLDLDFNILSIALFFLFVSAVSFFSFRIRNIALELAMVQMRNNTITSTVEFAFSPFIRIGKVISDRLSHSNPFILALDFLIEAPFKTILKILNSWFKFVNAKKEEIDL